METAWTIRPRRTGATAKAFKPGQAFADKSPGGPALQTSDNGSERHREASFGPPASGESPTGELALAAPLTGRLALVRRLRGALPTGRSLPDEAWRRRHRALLWVLWLHPPGIVVFALLQGFGATHSLFEGSVVATIGSLATLATVLGRTRKLCSGLVALGLLTSSAVVVHISGGFIEAHFHFFVS